MNSKSLVNFFENHNSMVNVENFSRSDDFSNPPPLLHVNERVVMIRGDRDVQYGTIRWIGNLSGHRNLMAGVEFDNPVGSGTGQHNGVRLFTARLNHAALIPVDGLIRAVDFDKENTDFDTIRKDFLIDFEEAHTSNNTNGSSITPRRTAVPTSNANMEWGSGCVAERPLASPWNSISVYRHIGKPRGIQGKCNSCYLDATLFALFASTDSFDDVLSRPRNVLDTALYEDVRQCLKYGIVDELRRNGYVPNETVMKLRRLLARALPEVTGLTTDEKDPEEFMNMLFGKVLRVNPDIRLSTGQTEYIYPVVCEDGFSRTTLTTVQALLDRNFAVSGVKLNSVPNRMMVQLSRFGNKKICEYVVPSPKLKLSNFLCGHHDEYLELASVICIESSHYVSFIRVKDGQSAKWLFFNSMADRQGGDFTGYNLPEVIECDYYLENLLWPPNEDRLLGALSIPTDRKAKSERYESRASPDYLERMLRDVYICVYVR